MAKVVAKFHKVSYEQFKKDFFDCFNKNVIITDFGIVLDESGFETGVRKIYDSIKLPKRGKIPTGIRCRIDNDWVLKCYPRSGLGFKYRMQLNNTVGIIDSDYFGADNEGHIMAKITNDTNEGKTIEIESGKGFMQGIFVEYGITVDDDAVEIRNGGFGSTTGQK